MLTQMLRVLYLLACLSANELPRIAPAFVRTTARLARNVH